MARIKICTCLQNLKIVRSSSPTAIATACSSSLFEINRCQKLKLYNLENYKLLYWNKLWLIIINLPIKHTAVKLCSDMYSYNMSIKTVLMLIVQ